MSGVDKPWATVAVFPERELKIAIEKWWAEETSKQLNDPFAARGTLFDVVVEVDSLTAVDVLLVIEPILGCELPESLIRAGEYTDRNDMVGHLLPALRKFSSQRNLK